MRRRARARWPELAPHNSHEVSVDGRRILFHVPTTSLFELDELAADVLDLFREQPEVTEADLRRRFDGRHPPERVLETLEELLDLEIIHNGQPRPANRPPVAIANYPISTLVLNVNTGCNLSCTYCYKEDLTTPDRGPAHGLRDRGEVVRAAARRGQGARAGQPRVLRRRAALQHAADPRR